MSKRKKRQQKRKSYSDEFKQEAVRLLVTRGDTTVAEVADSLGVTPGQLYEWKSALSASAGNGPVAGETAEQEVERLRRELEQIQKENETLKKSIALFVKDMKL